MMDENLGRPRGLTRKTNQSKSDLRKIKRSMVGSVGHGVCDGALLDITQLHSLAKVS